MSVETSRTNQPGDGDDDEQTYGYRNADSAAVDDDLDDDTDALSGHDDEDDEGDDGVVYGTVVAEDTSADAAYPADAAAVDNPRPTFTPVDDGTADGSIDPSAPTLNEADDVPVVPAQADAPMTQAARSSVPADIAAVDADGPLLADGVGLRASWQQAQAEFVDDPRTAVADAAELVEHAAQTLIGSLQQRQRQLRTQWDNNGSGDGAAATAGQPDTEQLRHLMQDYRNLFNQLCRP